MKTWFEKSSIFSCVFILSLKLQLCLLVFVPFCMWACGEDAFLHFRKPQCLLHWARDGRVVGEEGKVKTQRHATWSGLWHVLFACERIKYLQNKKIIKKWIEQNSDRKENTIFQHCIYLWSTHLIFWMQRCVVCKNALYHSNSEQWTSDT